ncbi:glycosyl hydrolase family 65 protein [Adhaeribacter rhizoryzae]|uniref:Glycoside hydrolase family 65 protein n=1 Tax=Adhaeribacter rhizoryzae TaxID=2607907 RepID=A0A5M6DEH5_9BACT|nr:glycosyl hydrolase family 65 protein [Adhaeribacter rhizoryzae]KAA5544806.1 glycoside hydrolase family 65 protein [Adhaeribacter rhizoryzae]
MKRYLTLNEWSLIEEGFYPEYNKITESVCSLGNGRMGHRASFEEKYSGETQPGHYVAGISDQNTGTSEYSNQLRNAPNWIGINVEIDGEELDLATCQVLDFRRELNMREGYLERTFQAQLPSGKTVEVSALRFTSIADDELGAIRFAIMPLNFSGAISLTPYIDAHVNTTNINTEQKWQEIDREVEPGAGFIITETPNIPFQVCTGMRLQLEKDNAGVETTVALISQNNYIGNRLTATVNENEQLVLYKYAAVVTSENYPTEKLAIACNLALERAKQIGFAEMLDVQSAVWAEKWQLSDLVIKGDLAAQQAIRFNIFSLNQAYTGEDERLNISPSGFTGETYGDATTWPTEVYCLPFYLATTEPHVARNLLVYQYQHLPKAIENAQKSGFNNGAALFSESTLNGGENLDNLELIAAGIHRNGAIALAIYDYICYTGDTEYLYQHGLEILVGIARFGAQQVNWSEKKNKYELNPNNWYTNALAAWTLEYTLAALQEVKQTAPTRYEALKEILNFDEEKETANWLEISNKMYFPVDEEKGIFLPQDGYLENEQILETKPETNEQQIIPHPDVLEGLYFLEERYDLAAIRRNYDFYAARTGQKAASLLGIHAVLAAKLGYLEQAYDYFMRSARYNLDDYRHETEKSCDLTSMAGAWLAVVKGFGGMRVLNNQLYLNPIKPEQWQSYTFKIRFQGHLLDITVAQSTIKILNQDDQPFTFYLYGKAENIPANNIGSFKRQPEKV